jgi:nitrogenase iron protein NifH
VLNRRAVENEEKKVRAFAEANNLEIVADIPRSNDIIHYEDQNKTVIEGDPSLDVSKRFLALAELLLEEAEKDA